MVYRKMLIFKEEVSLGSLFIELGSFSIFVSVGSELVAFWIRFLNLGCLRITFLGIIFSLSVCAHVEMGDDGLVFNLVSDGQYSALEIIHQG